MIDASMLSFLAPCFAASLILAGIHAYLGVHVVERGVIFVDLSLAQIAALGATIALLMPFSNGDPHAPVVYWVSLVFTFMGAFVFATIRSKRGRIPQEAIIGIFYAFASALTVLLISKTPHGDSDIQEVLFGNILSVSWGQITTIGIVFGIIALVHLVFFRKFFTLTESFENGENHQVGFFNFWNFLFYISIGLVIVFAVKVNGVIPVFSFLIIPAVSAIMIAKNKVSVIIIAIIISILASFFGLNFSFHYDFPAGSSIVAVLGGIFILAALYKIIKDLIFRKV